MVGATSLFHSKRPEAARRRSRGLAEMSRRDRRGSTRVGRARLVPSCRVETGRCLNGLDKADTGRRRGVTILRRFPLPDIRQRRSLRDSSVARTAAHDRTRSPPINVGAVGFHVNSGAADAAVSQRFLNDGQVRARVQQVMCARMSQRMQTHSQLKLDTRLLRRPVEDHARPLAREWEQQNVRTLVRRYSLE